MVSTPPVIVSLRLAHLRAQEAVKCAAWHVATMQFLCCLELTEKRGDAACFSFFALRLHECYAKMGLLEKAKIYRQMAEMDPLNGADSMV
ncbi:MAG: hypothetical protein H7095_08245 [Pseudopedobacter sp.]|nr:hypothetical protein [Deinococcales bacterium]